MACGSGSDFPVETGGAGLQRAVFPVALMNKGPRLGARTLCVDFSVFSPPGSCIHSQILPNAAVKSRGSSDLGPALETSPVSLMGAARGAQRRGDCCLS